LPERIVTLTSISWLVASRPATAPGFAALAIAA
jgi:hypothetical protein